MHMPKVLQPVCWMKLLGASEHTEDDHTCPWCGVTFPLHCPETGEVLRQETEPQPMEHERVPDTPPH